MSTLLANNNEVYCDESHRVESAPIHAKHNLNVKNDHEVNDLTSTKSDQIDFKEANNNQQQANGTRILTSFVLVFITFLKISFHYADLFIDGYLCYLYFTINNNEQNFYLTLAFSLLPNILISHFLLIYELFNSDELCKNLHKLIKVVFIIIIINSQLQAFCNYIVWVLLKLSKQKQNIKQLVIDIEYVVLMTNMFYILTNSFPLALVQFDIFLSNSNQQLKDHRQLQQFQITKIIFSLIKISFYSSQFLNHFLRYEFKFKFNGILFYLFRIFSNVLILVTKLLPLVLLLNTFKKWTVIYLICFKLPLMCLITNTYVTRLYLSTDKNQPSVSASLMRLFWTLLMSVLKLISHFEDSMCCRKKLTSYFVIKFIFDFAEIAISFFVLIFHSYKLNDIKNQQFSLLLLAFLLITTTSCFFVSLLFEYIYWNFIFVKILNHTDTTVTNNKSKNNSIVIRHFKQWLRAQVLPIRVKASAIKPTDIANIDKNKNTNNDGDTDTNIHLLPLKSI